MLVKLGSMDVSGAHADPWHRTSAAAEPVVLIQSVLASTFCIPSRKGTAP